MTVRGIAAFQPAFFFLRKPHADYIVPRSPCLLEHLYLHDRVAATVNTGQSLSLNQPWAIFRLKSPPDVHLAADLTDRAATTAPSCILTAYYRRWSSVLRGVFEHLSFAISDQYRLIIFLSKAPIGERGRSANIPSPACLAYTNCRETLPGTSSE